MKYAAPHGAVGKFESFGAGALTARSRKSRNIALATLSQVALLFGLTCLTLPASAAPCTPFTTGCSAAGGDGPSPPRGGSGGEGNGHGGNGTTINGSSVTIATPGGASAGGSGGNGGAGDTGFATGGLLGLYATGNMAVNTTVGGGNGQPGPDGNNFGAGGGGGGVGIYEVGSELIVGNFVIRGGNGGKGGDGLAGSSANGGGGGGGGAGIAISSTTDVTNNGNIIGGNGGAGGQGGYAGGGGGGGDGIVFTAFGLTLNQYGSVTGGQGGAGATGANGSSAAGDSGAGINLIGSSVSIYNIGSISGGDANGGAAGVGIMTNGAASIYNQGVIGGGLNNDGVTRAAAIRFGGSNNLYQATAGAHLEGGIELIDNAAATVASLVGPLTYTNEFLLGSGSTLTFRTLPGDLSVSGVISGSGGVRKLDSGTLTLTGMNTYTGGTRLSAGTTSVSSDANLGDAAGALTFDGGTLQITGTSFTGTSRTINWGGGGFDIADAANSFVVSQSLTGTGALTKLGAGTLMVTGTNSYTGATTVDAGRLAVNGSIASSSLLTVNAGGVVGGTGILPTTVIANGGVLAPGNSIGTITVSGDLTLHSSSAYNVEVSPTAADRTNVTGTATLAGSVNATYATGSYTAKRYTILNAVGGVSGTFSALNNNSLPGNVTAALNYGANDVYLDLTLVYQGPDQPRGLNQNQQSVSNALTNYFNSSGGIPTAFVKLSANGLSQVSGEAGSSIVLPMTDDVNLFTNAVFDGAFGGWTNDASSSGGLLRDAARDPNGALGFAPAERVTMKANEAFASLPLKAPPADAFAARWGVWATGYGATSRVSGDTAVGSSTTTSSIYGAVAGASYRFSPNTIIGFALGGAGTDFSLDGGFGSGKADIFHAAVYGLHNIGRAYVAGLVGYGWQEASTDRTVTAAGMDMLHASFRPQTLSGRLEAGYRLATPFANVTPYGALQMAAFFIPSYSESATSGSNQFALAYDARTASAVRTELGVRLAKSYGLSDGILTLKGRAAWAYDSYAERGATATFQILPGATFVVNGASPDSHVALLSAGADYGLGNGWSLAASFDGEFSGNSTIYAGKGAIRRVW